MLKLSYSANGISDINIFDAAKNIKKFGFSGVELCFHKEQFNPFTLTTDDLKKIKEFLAKEKITPVSLNTSTPFILSDVMPHGPSIVDLDSTERKKRIEITKKGIEIANFLEIPVVSFTSGFLIDDQLKTPNYNPHDLLATSINECLSDIGNVTLVIEPEPGMLIENMQDGIDIIKKVNSPSFKLLIDIGHAYCAGDTYLSDIEKALPYTAHMHLADIKSGYKLTTITSESLMGKLENLTLNKIDVGYLIYFKKEESFALVDKNNIVYFYKKKVHLSEHKKLEELQKEYKIKSLKTCKIDEIINKKVSQDNEREILAYFESIQKMEDSFFRIFIAILRFLRTEKSDDGTIFIDKPMGYTIRGKVHYHEFPGKGEIDFASVFSVLKKNNYAGFISVELYNHVDVWSEVIPKSYTYLTNLLKKV
ncbi:MAG: sugar phosphate isomerase/epimerase family protein [Alphaproteobacteria bacterium]|nr:sugar phosphate isomerase/epimerase family protein [Alphaproteobacteria bacterium]